MGAIGIAVQLAALEIMRRAGVDYLTATALAVEITILHNYVWHERYTWVDRTQASPGAWLGRLVSFHVTNGAVSLLGNVVLMRWLVGEAHLPVVPANLVAITACWLLNFVLSDRVVFGTARNKPRICTDFHGLFTARDAKGRKPDFEQKQLCDP